MTAVQFSAEGLFSFPRSSCTSFCRPPAVGSRGRAVCRSNWRRLVLVTWRWESQESEEATYRITLNLSLLTPSHSSIPPGLQTCLPYHPNQAQLVTAPVQLEPQERAGLNYLKGFCLFVCSFFCPNYNLLSWVGGMSPLWRVTCMLALCPCSFALRCERARAEHCPARGERVGEGRDGCM